VCDFGQLTEDKRSMLFGSIPAGDVWGVGRHITEKLLAMHITTAEDLRTTNLDTIRRHFSIFLARTVNELNGIACIELEEVGAPRQQIMASRLFGATVSRLPDPVESVANFTTRAAENISQDGTMAVSVCVFIRTNPLKEDHPQYQRSLIVTLARPSDDTTTLIGAAIAELKAIYRNGCHYKKTGVLLIGLHPKEESQPGLVDDPMTLARSDRLMRVMDAINTKIGQGSVGIAASGIRQKWAMRRERKSQSYTTDWKKLPVAE